MTNPTDIYKNRPPVLQVLPELETGGVERGTIEVAAELSRMGWRNFVISQGGVMVRELARLGVEHITLPVKSKNPLRILANSKKIAQVIHDNKIGLVHARSRAPAWSAYRAAKLAGVPYLATYHGTYGLGPLGIKKLYNAVMTKGERTIAISQFIAAHLVENYNIPVGNIRVVHRGVDLSRFDPSCVSAERIVQLANSWRVPEDQPVVMLPGRLSRWKGQLLLVDAISKMRHKKFRCLLVGSDQGRTGYRREIERAVQKHGLDSVVQIVDQCDDMAAGYMLSDIVVSASTDPEAFGRVVVEGQAMGRIVVAANHGGASETVEDGQTGFHFVPGDAVSLANMLDKAIAMETEKREAIAEQAKQSARANFSRSLMCDRVLAVYEEILATTANDGA